MSLPSSWMKNNSSKKPTRRLATCFHTGFLLGLFLYHENGGDMFFKNVG
jgi:hypothetical protein